MHDRGGVSGDGWPGIDLASVLRLFLDGRPPAVSRLVVADVERARGDVHRALDGYLDDGEIVVSWVLTMDIAGADGSRYLAHRAGGGGDGHDHPMAWAALGMLMTSVDVARAQLAERTADGEDDDE